MTITLNNIGSGELYLQIMKAICGETDGLSVADLMAHKSPYTPQLGFSKRTYVDIQKRPLDFKEEQKYFVKADVIDFLNKGEYFDVTLCIDGIEHLEKRKGMELVYLLEKYSSKQIIFTPLGYCEQEYIEEPDRHLSGWEPSYFDGWGIIVLPNFHPSLKNKGAFFAWHCDDIKTDFERVKNELKSII